MRGLTVPSSIPLTFQVQIYTYIYKKPNFFGKIVLMSSFCTNLR